MQLGMQLWTHSARSWKGPCKAAASDEVELYSALMQWPFAGLFQWLAWENGSESKLWWQGRGQKQRRGQNESCDGREGVRSWDSCVMGVLGQEAVSGQEVVIGVLGQEAVPWVYLLLGQEAVRAVLGQETVSGLY